MSDLAIAQARRWLGTPFKASASIQGVGCDCVGLIEGIARSLGISSPQRDLVQNDILMAATVFLVPVHDNTQGSKPGDLVLLSAQPGGVPIHAALITEKADTLIHAHWNCGVVENRFGNWFLRRVTHTFSWPTLSIFEDI